MHLGIVRDNTKNDDDIMKNDIYCVFGFEEENKWIWGRAWWRYKWQNLLEMKVLKRCFVVEPRKTKPLDYLITHCNWKCKGECYTFTLFHKSSQCRRAEVTFEDSVTKVRINRTQCKKKLEEKNNYSTQVQMLVSTWPGTETDFTTWSKIISNKLQGASDSQI